MIRLAHGLEPRPGVGSTHFLGAACECAGLKAVFTLQQLQVGEVGGLHSARVTPGPAQSEVDYYLVCGTGSQNSKSGPVYWHSRIPDFIREALHSAL